MKNSHALLVRLTLAVVAATSLCASLAFRGAPSSVWFYNGRHQREVRHLLERAENWKLPSCATCSDLAAPDIKINPNASQRDSYVGAAATLAFGAEAYATIGKPDLAEQSAAAAHENLQHANDLCSPSTPGVDAQGMTPASLHMWNCPAPFELDP